MTRADGAKRRTTARLLRRAAASIDTYGNCTRFSLERRFPDFRCERSELRELPKERQWELTDFTVTLLGDDDVGDTLARGVLVVDLLAIDHHDHVGVLLDRAGFAQVGHHGLLVITLFDTAV